MSHKIDYATLRSVNVVESSTQSVTLAGGATQTTQMTGVFSNWATLIANRTVVNCLLVPTGGGSGAYFGYHFQGVGGSLAQSDYGFSITNLDPSNSYTWTYKIIVTII